MGEWLRKSIRIFILGVVAMSLQNSRGNISTSAESTCTFSFTSRNFVRHVTSMKRFHDYGRTPELPKAAESVNFLQTAQKQDKCSKTQDQIRSSGKMKSCKPSAKSTRQLRRNERERCRKARLNAAFQVLRSVVPNNVSTGTSERKMTQVEILRLAKNYISNLTELLQDNNDYRYRTFCSDWVFFSPELVWRGICTTPYNMFV